MILTQWVIVFLSIAMPSQFKYRAYTSEGDSRSGVIAARSAAAVEEYLSQLHLFPVSIKPASSRRFNPLGFLTRRHYEHLIMFTNALATMHRSGIPLLRALDIIRIGEGDSHINDIIEQVRLQLQAGTSLSDALGEFPELFSPVYTTSVAAGEETGKLDLILDELARMLENEMELNRQIKSAVRYPLVVITVIIAAFLVVMTWVIPRFMDFYSTFDAQLPLATRILIATSGFVANQWYLWLGMAVIVAFAFRKFVSTSAGRLWYDRRLARLPILGEIIIKGNVARFALMFGILFRAGLPLVKGMEILAGTVKNSQIAREIVFLAETFRKGKPIPFDSPELEFMPDQSLHMIAIGLESGSLENMLTEVSEHYTKEVLYRSRQLTSAIEPILTLILGGFVLLLALAIFLPMWNLIQIFQH